MSIEQKTDDITRRVGEVCRKAFEFVEADIKVPGTLTRNNRDQMLIGCLIHMLMDHERRGASVEEIDSLQVRLQEIIFALQGADRKKSNQSLDEKQV